MKRTNVTADESQTGDGTTSDGSNIAGKAVSGKVRLDILLVEQGLVPSRERAQALIMAGQVLVDEQKEGKSGTKVAATAVIRILGEAQKYVSRGGLKLERAIEHWNIRIDSGVAVDIGASTGGFTDCLLQYGAAGVIAIDTGYGQMDARLRNDPRVALLERTNARYLTPEKLRPLPAADQIRLLVMDVSFISATKVLPAVVRAVLARRAGAEGGSNAAVALELVLLVKPQFEVGRGFVGKGGIVRDEAAQLAAVETVKSCAEGLGFANLEVIESPILGTEGNREFLLFGVIPASV